MLCWLGYLWPWPLTLTFDLWPWIFKVKLYLGNGRPNCHGMKGTRVSRMPWCETQWKWVNWMLRWLGYLWPWIFKVKLYLGNGRLDCHVTKGTGVVRMPWCKTQPLWGRGYCYRRGDLRCRVSVDSSSLPICPIWACPWAKNLSNLPQIGSRLCGMHTSEIAGWIYPI